MRYALLVLLAGSCATSRKAAEIVNDTAAITGIVHAAVQRYVPDPTPIPALTPRQLAIINLVPVALMMGAAVWHFVEEWRAAPATVAP